MSTIVKTGKRLVGNNRDYRESLMRGFAAEAMFVVLALVRGWSVETASPSANRHEHWDYLITKGNEQYKVDVKAMKKLSRKDSAPQDKWFWVELRGSRGHDNGWLHDGSAQLLAIERKDDFLLVFKADIRNIVYALVDFNKPLVNKPSEAKYRLYSRQNVGDLLTLIETKLLEACAYDIWDKEVLMAQKRWEVYNKMKEEREELLAQLREKDEQIAALKGEIAFLKQQLASQASPEVSYQYRGEIDVPNDVKKSKKGRKKE